MKKSIAIWGAFAILVCISCSLIPFSDPDRPPDYNDERTPTPVVTMEPGELCDKFFWGKWLRMDTEEYWYIADRNAKIKGRYDFYISSRDSSKIVVKKSRIETAYLDETEYTIEKSTDNVLKVNNGEYYLYRMASAQGELTGRISGLTSQAVKGLSLGGLNKIRTVITNTNNPSNKRDVETDDNGTFSSDEIIPGDEYSIQTVLTTSDGTTIDGPELNFQPLNEQSDLGTITVTDNGYNYKIDYRDRNSKNKYFYAARTYSLEVYIRNIGSEDSTATTYRIMSMEQDGVTISGIKEQDIIGTIEPKKSRSLIMNVRLEEPPDAYVDKKINFELLAYNSVTGKQEVWQDSITIRFFQKPLNIHVSSLYNQVYGVVLSDVTGAIWFQTQRDNMATNYNYSSKIEVPYLPGGYTISLSRATAESEDRYSIGIETQSAGKDDLKAFVDVTAYEPNDREDLSKVVHLDDVVNAYLHKNDVDFYRINTRKVYKPVIRMYTNYKDDNSSVNTIDINSSTLGADIYYTIDGSTPSRENGIRYTGTFELTETKTVKAMAVREGYLDSAVTEKECYIEVAISSAAYDRLMITDIFTTVDFRARVEKRWFAVEVTQGGNYFFQCADYTEGIFDKYGYLITGADVRVSILNEDHTPVTGAVDIDGCYKTPLSLDLRPGVYIIALTRTSSTYGTTNCQIRFYQ